MTDRYAPHPATLPRSRAAQPQMAAETRPPHAATVARSRTAQTKRAAEARLPHPATLPRSFVAQPTTRNAFADLRFLDSDNNLTKEGQRNARKQQRLAKEKREAEQQREQERREKGAQAEAKRKQEEEARKRAALKNQQQRERKTERVQGSAKYEETEKIDYSNDLALKNCCEIYANALLKDRHLEINVKFTAAVSRKTGTVSLRPSGVLTLERLQELSPSLARRISRIEKTEAWDTHVCSEVFATAALLNAEPGLNTNQIKYYTLSRISREDTAYAEPCKNCKQWINGEVLGD